MAGHAPTLSFLKGIKTEVLPVGTSLCRIHEKNNGPIWFGPKQGHPAAYRFDATRGEYRTMYVAATLDGSFVETVLHGKAGNRIVSRGYVDRLAWTFLISSRPLSVVKLYDEGLLWHGTDAGVSSAPDYTEPRRIALAVWTEGGTVDGIAYRARHNNGEMCYALFDRVSAADFAVDAPNLFADHAGLVDQLVDKYGSAMDDSPPVPPP